MKNNNVTPKFLTIIGAILIIIGAFLPFLNSPRLFGMQLGPNYPGWNWGTAMGVIFNHGYISPVGDGKVTAILGAIMLNLVLLPITKVRIYIGFIIAAISLVVLAIVVIDLQMPWIMMLMGQPLPSGLLITATGTLMTLAGGYKKIIEAK